MTKYLSSILYAHFLADYIGQRVADVLLCFEPFLETLSAMRRSAKIRIGCQIIFPPSSDRIKGAVHLLLLFYIRKTSLARTKVRILFIGRDVCYTVIIIRSTLQALAELLTYCLQVSGQKGYSFGRYPFLLEGRWRSISNMTPSANTRYSSSQSFVG